MTAGARLVDVAREAGVGASIASRVLNGDPSVSVRPETRERILAAARKLKYRPNAFARGLKLQKTMTLGLVINLAYSENAELVAAVERRAAAAGYVTLLADANEFQERGEAYGRLLYERRVDGLLIATALGSDRFVRELRGHGLPFLLVNRRVSGIGLSITVDDALGMRVAVEHLIGLGHRRIAHIAGPPSADVCRRRLAGFRAAMRAAGFAVPRELVLESSFEEDGGFLAMERLLELEPPPTAVAIWSLTAAVGALAAARRNGLRLPDDLSLVALHDAPIAAYLDPPLATVRMPLREMAERSVDSLLEVLAGRRPRSVVVRTPAPLLVGRPSTAPLRGPALTRRSGGENIARGSEKRFPPRQKAAPTPLRKEDLP